MGIDKIIDMIDHRSVRTADIRSVHIEDIPNSSRVNYTIMFSKLDTHRLLLETCRINESSTTSYFLCGNEVVQVTVPNVLQKMKQEKICLMREGKKALWNLRIFHKNLWTVRTAAKIVEKAISHYNKTTTSTNEVSYISCNPHCAYMGFHNHEIRQIMMTFLRDVEKMDFRPVVEQAEIVEFEPEELIRARQFTLIEEKAEEKQSTSTEVHTSAKAPKRNLELTIKLKDNVMVSGKEKKNAKKLTKYLQRVLQNDKFEVKLVNKVDDIPEVHTTSVKQPILNDELDLNTEDDLSD